MKKGLLLTLAFALFFAFSGGAVDAKPRFGGMKSPTKSYTSTPSKPADNINKSSSGTGATKPGTTGTTANRGFFGGGSFMKGMMIGGLAGMLFGGAFGNLGFMGNMFGFLINILAIYIGIRIISSIIRYFRNRNRPARPDNRGPY